jgi:acyl-CoA dehydrogenase
MNNHLLVDDQLAMLRKTVKLFVKDQVEPVEQRQEEYSRELPLGIVTSLQEKARIAGLRALGAKIDWGGAGLSLYERSVIFEEASQHRFGLYHPAGDAFGEELPSFLEECTQEQIHSYVKPAVQQGKGCFLAVWEEKEDNDLENITCRAEKDGDEWVINGHKSYIQKMDQAGFGVVLVNCSDGNGAGKPTLFILEKDDLYEKTETTLIDVQKTHELIFQDVRIHDRRRIGKVGEGAEFVHQWLAESQVLLAARCLGVATKALEYAKEYAKIRITRGQPLAEFPSIRSMFGNGLMNLQAARLMVQDAAKKVDQGKKDARISAQKAKVFGVETAAKIIDDVLQIHGGAGFAGDLPFERWYKEIRLAKVDLQKKDTILEEIARLHLK